MSFGMVVFPMVSPGLTLAQRPDSPRPVMVRPTAQAVPTDKQPVLDGE